MVRVIALEEAVDDIYLYLVDESLYIVDGVGWRGRCCSVVETGKRNSLLDQGDDTTTATTKGFITAVSKNNQHKNCGFLCQVPPVG